MRKLSKTTNDYEFRMLCNAQRTNHVMRLVCPRCKETLVQVDVESFSRCPFCGYRFEFNMDLEDYMLSDLMENWIKQQHNLYSEHRDF